MAENEWGSNLSFLLAMIGSAVGLGNIWRYSYVLYSNGGGAFYIPYIIALILMGVPFLVLEYGIGFNYGSSFAKAVTKISPRWKFLGWLLPVILFFMLCYYAALVGWDGIYLALSFFKGWGADPNTYFSGTLLHASDSYTGLATFVPVVAVSMLVIWIIIWSVSHRDLESGLGKVSKIFVPLLFAVMAVIVIFSLTLPGASIGLSKLFNPDWSLLGHFDVWMAAFGQIIFSLSLGTSGAFTFAGYLGKEEDFISNTICVVLANSIFENFAALGVFAILGHMSFVTATPVENLVSEGTGLVFVVYPTVLNVLGQWGYVIGPLFFLAILIAGLTSLLALIEPFSISIQNKFGLSRSKTVSVMIPVAAVLSMVYATAFGPALLGYVDLVINQIVALGAIVFECILFAWIFPAEELIDFLNAQSKSIKLGRWWILIVKYILPVGVALVWIGGMADFIVECSHIQLIVSLISIIIIFAVTFILKSLPARNPEWDDVEERIR